MDFSYTSRNVETLIDIKPQRHDKAIEAGLIKH